MLSSYRIHYKINISLNFKIKQAENLYFLMLEVKMLHILNIIIIIVIIIIISVLLKGTSFTASGET